MVSTRWSSPHARPWALALLVAFAASALHPTAWAATVQVETIDGQRVAVAIRGLELAGEHYDIEFAPTTAGELYGDPPAFDFDHRDAATAAVEAVITALNGTDAERVGDADDVRHRFYIGFEPFFDDTRARAGQMFTSWQSFGEAVLQPHMPNVFATFTPVPLPASLPLLAGACAALGALGWRRRVAGRALRGVRAPRSHS